MFSDLKMGAWKSQAPLKYQEDSFAIEPSIDKNTLFQVKKTVRVYGSRISSFFFFVGCYTIQMHMYCTSYEIFYRLSLKSP